MEWKNKRKIKLLYTEDGKMLWSKFFPEVPPVQVSANRDAIMYNNYKRQMDEAIRQAVPVENIEVAKMYIAFDYPIKKGEVYEIDCEYIVKSSSNGYSIEIINPARLPL